MESIALDAAGHRRSPATTPGYHQGRPTRNKGEHYSARGAVLVRRGKGGKRREVGLLSGQQLFRSLREISGPASCPGFCVSSDSAAAVTGVGAAALRFGCGSETNGTASRVVPTVS